MVHRRHAWAEDGDVGKVGAQIQVFDGDVPLGIVEGDEAVLGHGGKSSFYKNHWPVRLR